MTARKEAAPDKGAAALAETNGKPKAIKFRDLELTAPSKMPPTLLFDIAEIEAGDGNIMPLFRILRSLLGPDQFTDVRNSFTDKDTDDDVYGAVDKLLGELMGAYGVSLGEQ